MNDIHASAKAGRVVIISDTHLGRPHCAAASAAALRPLWQGADQCVINGDIAEIHHPDQWAVAARQTMQLFDLCEADDVELTMLSGNHDPFISDIRHLHLAKDAVLVTHGDVLHPAVAPWSPAAGRIRAAYHDALASVDVAARDELEQRLIAAQHASHAEWHDLKKETSKSTLLGMMTRPWAIVQVMLYWRQVPRLAAEFAARCAPRARFVVIGHTHRPGIWHVDERVIINTGCYGFPGSPRAVVLEGNRLSVWRIVMRSGAYHLADRPLAQFDDVHDSVAASSTLRVEHATG